jgi:leucyl-tRNA synthetase
VKKVGPEVHAYHFTPHKDQNRYGYCQALYFELVNGEKNETKDEEKMIHEVKWIDRAAMSKYLNLENNLMYWDIFEKGERSFDGEGKLIHSGKFDGCDSASVKIEITESVCGKWVAKYKLRDWVFSRQRYWGEPIPLIHCENCALIDPAGKGIVPVPEKDLPVVLPRVKSYEPTGTGESPLAAIAKWVNVKCPVCKGPAKRETNTMPQWAGSSWYYLRYEDPKNSKAFVDPKKEKYWSPVDMYVGGAEHATRHLIYARFWHKFLYDNGVVSTIEPFIKLQHVGLIMGEDGRKMSKRFGNVINPDEIVKNFGADSLRIYEMFMGPFDQQIAWSTASIVGSRRFIERVWKLREKVSTVKNGAIKNIPMALKDSVATESVSNSHDAKFADKILHKTIKKVTDDIENLRFNTAVSSLMIAVNEFEKCDSLSRKQYEALLQLLAPFAPHFTEELWFALGNKKSIHISGWPDFNAALALDDEKTIMVQVNGKIRGSFIVPSDATKEDIEKSAQELPEAKKWLEGKKIVKVIVVPGKLVNIVVV